MNQANEIISGTVERVIFQSADGGFAVFVLVTPSFSTTVRGHIPSVREGQEVDVEGAWTVHQKFGKQFFAERCLQRMPTSLSGLKKYLGSGVIKGIGKAYGEKLVDYFGDRILEIIENEPHRLHEVGGFGERRVAMIVESWKTQRATAQIMVFLQEKGASPAYAAKIYKQYGDSALNVLSDNPYRLANDVWGIGFSIADSIAQNLGFTRTDERRLHAGISFVFSAAAAQGHLYVEKSKLWEKACPMLELSEDEIPLLEKAYDILLAQGHVISLHDKEVEYRGLMAHYKTEKAVAENCTRLLSTPSPHRLDLEAMYNTLRIPRPTEIALNEDQQKGVMTALSHKVSIITGGPGTGKTTLVRKLLSLLEKENLNVKLCAPTGRASKRLMESTGHFALTIHRLLEFDPANKRFSKDEYNTLKVDVLIVDEVSMVDIFLAHSLLQALPSSAHLVMIGDSDQLPSVGPGNVLRDLLESKAIPSVRLTEIFRQAQSSLIIVNAHRINKGEFPLSPSASPETTPDFIFLKETEAQNIPTHLKRLFSGEIKRRGFSPLDVHVLAPMNRGIAGTQTLNLFLQSLIYPAERPSIAFRGTNFHPGDKVMQIRNNYDKNVFNGDIGFVKEVDTTEQMLIVEYGERPVEYEISELDELILAYATTIHKSQGSEYPVVIIPLFMQHFILLQRNLLYTALTRAQKLCILMGEPRAIAMAIKKVDATSRITFLQSMLSL
ncbi:TPA: ATP-dependent RecD-like DNA helicase [Candidatus Dependentiae bacterium]|nr:MAG: Helicase, RecD/TraA family [candidate division TM6 bacterium GW2011_GWF2_43_87]HBL98319.1 ATP-dependent RecD-like DNA helicase [Candidatus Dependentiae bacterium]